MEKFEVKIEKKTKISKIFNSKENANYKTYKRGELKS